MKHFKNLSLLLMALASFALVGCQAESASYPQGDVTAIIPFNAGGGIDVSGRALLTEMNDVFDGVTFVPTNVTGASGTVGATELYYSDNDGYTIMLAGNGLNVAHVANNFELTYQDYELIAQYATSELGLYVSADSPYTTYEAFVSAAAQNPGSIKMGVLTATMNNYAVLAIEAENDISFQHIVVGGDASPQPELLSGRIDAYVVAVSQNVAYMESGDFRCLGVFADERVASMPEVPTFAELGIAEDYQLSFGMWAPKDTPEEVVATLAQEVKVACENPDFIRSMEAMGYTAAFLDTAEYTESMAASLESVIALTEHLNSSGKTSSADPYNDPYTFPILLVVLIVVLSILEIVRKIIKKETFQIKFISIFKGNALVFILGLLLYAICFEFMGYIISSTLFLIGMILYLQYVATKLLNRKIVIQTAIGCVVFSVATYLFFTLVAGVALPVSFLGI